MNKRERGFMYRKARYVEDERVGFSFTGQIGHVRAQQDHDDCDELCAYPLEFRPLGNPYWFLVREDELELIDD